MINQILNTMKLAFIVKLLTKESFFTLAPIPDFIQTKSDLNGELDILLTKDAPKDYIYKFFIAKNSQALSLGDFYSVETIKNSNRIIITQHINYKEEKKPILLSEDCCFIKKNKNFGCSEELLESLKFIFSEETKH